MIGKVAADDFEKVGTGLDNKAQGSKIRHTGGYSQAQSVSLFKQPDNLFVT